MLKYTSFAAVLLASAALWPVGAIAQQGPGGPAEMVPGQHHVRMNMYIAQATGGRFKVVKNLGAIDPNSGRGFAQISFTGIGTLDDVMYIVSPTKVDLMNFGTTSGVNGSIVWLVQ